MTATDQRTTDLFHHQTTSCISTNVGSITDFLFTSSHSSHDEQISVRFFN
jgi:hypothetical protein